MVPPRSIPPRRCAGVALLVALSSGLSGCDRSPATPEELAGGKWSATPDRAPRLGTDGLTPEQRRQVEELRAIGYGSGDRPAPALDSVTHHEEARALSGLNFYVSGHAPEAFLIDMEGRLLHRWAHDYDELWPELDVPADAAGRGKWRRAHLFENGDLLAIHEGIGMIKLDRGSNLLWEYPGRTHHDVHVMEDGTLWTLGREALMIPRVHAELPSLDDYLVELDPGGRELRRISVLAALENGGYDELLLNLEPERRDLFHTNSIEVLDGRLAERLPAFAAGNLLISMRHLDRIAVVDPEAEAVVWDMEGDFRWQHDPTVLANGNLMLFDNRGRGEASTVYEYDPVTREVVWSYRGTAERPFYSKTCGTAYRLANGNTLISESDGGRAFEVTPEKEVVWEFFNPHRAGEDQEYIACLYDLQRIVPVEPFPWLGE